MDCHFLNYTSSCTDLTNIATMQIELFIGIIGAVIITSYFYKRENNKKKSRGKRLTKANVNLIIPLREQVRIFVDFLKNENFPEPDNLKNRWTQIQNWKDRISPLFVISGDFMNVEQQIMIGRILEDLERDLTFEMPKEGDEYDVKRLQFHLREYLKMNKKVVKEALDEANAESKKRIDRIPNLDSETGKLYKKNILRGIKENEDVVKDIIKD